MPRPSDGEEANKPRKRRRRRFGNRKKKLSPENITGPGFGYFASGVSASLRPISWLWRITARTLRWSNSQIDERRGGARSANAGFEALLPGGVVVCGAVIAALIFR